MIHRIRAIALLATTVCLLPLCAAAQSGSGSAWHRETWKISPDTKPQARADTGRPSPDAHPRTIAQTPWVLVGFVMGGTFQVNTASLQACARLGSNFIKKADEASAFCLDPDSGAVVNLLR